MVKGKATFKVENSSGTLYYTYGNYAGTILGILIADAILELFRNNLGIIENN